MTFSRRERRKNGFAFWNRAGPLGPDAPVLAAGTADPEEPQGHGAAESKGEKGAGETRYCPAVKKIKALDHS